MTFFINETLIFQTTFCKSLKKNDKIINFSIYYFQNNMSCQFWIKIEQVIRLKLCFSEDNHKTYDFVTHDLEFRNNNACYFNTITCCLIQKEWTFLVADVNQKVCLPWFEVIHKYIFIYQTTISFMLFERYFMTIFTWSLFKITSIK